MIEWGVSVGVGFAIALVALRPALVPVFTADADVRHLTLQVMLLVAALQPVNAVLFVLDGVLIGAGDVTYLALAMIAALVVYVPAATAVLIAVGGLLCLWGALAIWMGARCVGMATRFAGTRWQVTGAVRAVCSPPRLQGRPRRDFLP
jgi:Na+-driven multidrug efflux pump